MEEVPKDVIFLETTFFAFEKMFSTFPYKIFVVVSVHIIGRS